MEVSPERRAVWQERPPPSARELAAKYDVPLPVVWLVIGVAWSCVIVAVAMHCVVKLFVRRRPRLRVVREA